MTNSRNDDWQAVKDAAVKLKGSVTALAKKMQEEKVSSIESPPDLLSTVNVPDQKKTRVVKPAYRELKLPELNVPADLNSQELIKLTENLKFSVFQIYSASVYAGRIDSNPELNKYGYYKYEFETMTTSEIVTLLNKLDSQLNAIQKEQKQPALKNSGKNAGSTSHRSGR